MHEKERQYIPSKVKKSIKIRQKNKCACCMERGQVFHHIYPVAFCKNKPHSFEKNIVLLCNEHHKKFHLGDPDTFETIYEYVWYLYFGEMPENDDIINISNELIKYIKKEIDDRNQI